MAREKPSRRMNADRRAPTTTRPTMTKPVVDTTPKGKGKARSSETDEKPSKEKCRQHFPNFRFDKGFGKLKNGYLPEVYVGNDKEIAYNYYLAPVETLKKFFTIPNGIRLYVQHERNVPFDTGKACDIHYIKVSRMQACM